MQGAPLARTTAWVLVLAATLCYSRMAFPQAPTGDRAAAQALFDEAMALRNGGDYPKACAKFDESLKLDPTVSTRFNLADCLERIGRFASAWSHFLEVEAATERAGEAKRAAAARRRATALEPRLSRVTIIVAAPAPGLSIARNDVQVGEAQWSTAMPVDAGRYVISADAPGKMRWEASVEVAGEGTTVTVDVPALQDAPDSVGPPGQPLPPGQPIVGPPSDDGGMSAQAVIGISLTGVGVVGLGVGAAFGLIAMSKKNEVDDLCPDLDRCTQEGIDINDEAKTAGTVSTISFIAGGVLAVGGLVLWLTAPSGAEASTTTGVASPAVRVGLTTSGLVLRGGW